MIEPTLRRSLAATTALVTALAGCWRADEPGLSDTAAAAASLGKGGGGADLVPYLIPPPAPHGVPTHPPPTCGESFTFTVVNQGTVATTVMSSVRVEASVGASPAHPVTVKLPPLSPGQAIQLSAPVRALPHLRVVVDPDGLVTENNERNNTLEYDCTLDCGTSATGTPLSVSLNPPITCPPRFSTYAWSDVYDARRVITNPVFPGAEGFGTDTPGGDPNVLIRVDSLSDNASSVDSIVRVSSVDVAHCLDPEPASGTPCTLRTAVSEAVAMALCGAPGCPRTVVFEVGGPIVLKHHIDITAPFLTIAGQTAPAPGVHLLGSFLQVRTHDVVVRHLAILPASCMAAPLAYCGAHADCDADEWCVAHHCRKRCDTAAECDAAGYRGFNREGEPVGIVDRGACVEVSAAVLGLPTSNTPYKVCTCNDTHAVVLRDNVAPYSLGAGCPGADQEFDDSLCLPRRRGSTATARCACGDLCHQFVAPASSDDAACDPTNASCCVLPQQTEDALGCAFDSDCADRIGEVCGALQDCGAACMGGLCIPMRRPQPDLEPHHIVLDHLTAGWANDEVVCTGILGIHDVTLSHSMVVMGENIGNTKAQVPHATGSLIEFHTRRMSLIDTLFAHQRGRHPVLSQDVSVLVANNVIYNPGFDAISLSGPHRLGPSVLSVDTQLMLTGPDTLIARSPSGATIRRTDQFGHTYASIHGIVEEAVPTQMPLIHAWYDAHPESEIWLGNVYDEWGAGQALFSTNKHNTVSYRHGGPHLLRTADRTISVSPLTLASSCDELYSGVMARSGARPGGIIESVIAQDVATRGGEHTDEVICARTGTAVTCDAHRCDAEGCRIVHSFVIAPGTTRRILDASAGCSPAYPSPQQTAPLQLPCGVIPMRQWLEALSDGLELAPNPQLTCP